jgi:hypothetical protein
MFSVQPQEDRLLDVAYQRQQTHHCQEELHFNTPHQQGYTNPHEYYQQQGFSHNTESFNRTEFQHQVQGYEYHPHHPYDMHQACFVPTSSTTHQEFHPPPQQNYNIAPPSTSTAPYHLPQQSIEFPPQHNMPPADDAQEGLPAQVLGKHQREIEFDDQDAESSKHMKLAGLIYNPNHVTLDILYDKALEKNPALSGEKWYTEIYTRHSVSILIDGKWINNPFYNPWFPENGRDWVGDWAMEKREKKLGNFVYHKIPTLKGYVQKGPFWSVPITHAASSTTIPRQPSRLVHTPSSSSDPSTQTASTSAISAPPFGSLPEQTKPASGVFMGGAGSRIQRGDIINTGFVRTTISFDDVADDVADEVIMADSLPYKSTRFG